jgi:hypothetical protein
MTLLESSKTTRQRVIAAEFWKNFGATPIHAALVAVGQRLCALVMYRLGVPM